MSNKTNVFLDDLKTFISSLEKWDLFMRIVNVKIFDPCHSIGGDFNFTINVTDKEWADLIKTLKDNNIKYHADKWFSYYPDETADSITIKVDRYKIRFYRN